MSKMNINKNITIASEPIDCQSQMKYHQLLSNLKISTEQNLTIQSIQHDTLDSEPGYRSSSPSTDSPRSISYPAPTEELQLETKYDDLLIILDWDDTLFPTNWLTEILQNTKNGVALVNDDEIALLNHLGNITVSLLNGLIVKYGSNNIHIVTNSLQGWIADSLNYASCISHSYKELEQLLHKHDITMDSAQTLYAKQEESSTPTKWKQLCINAIINGNKTKHSYSHIISAGDQWTDHYATKQSIASLSTFSPMHHMIKLKEKPNINDMINQMLYVQTCFGHIFNVISLSPNASACEPVIVDYHREELKYYNALKVQTNANANVNVVNK